MRTFSSEDISNIKKMIEEDKLPMDEVGAFFNCGYKPIRRICEAHGIGHYGKKSYIIKRRGENAIFTEEGDAIIKQMLAEEKPIHEIKMALNGVHERVISRRIKELGLEPTGLKIELTSDQLNEAKKMHEDGKTEQQIADFLGASRELAKRALYIELSLKPHINGKIRQDPEKLAKVLKMYDEGIGTVKIAEEFNVHRGSIEKILVDNGIDISRILTDEEKKRALELREKGLGTRAIGIALDRNRNTIQDYFHDIGLKNVQPPPKPPQPEPVTKICNVCSEEKPIEQFEKQKRILKDETETFSRRAQCRTCRSLRKAISGAILRHLKEANTSKGGASCFKHLPYTLLELKQHIESLFEPWMTWDNWGQYSKVIWDDNDPTTWTWHLDHIIPHCSFKYTSMTDQAFLDCWALSNLRPLSAKQNVLDNDRGMRLDDNVFDLSSENDIEQLTA
jgi:hypothetical protein